MVSKKIIYVAYSPYENQGKILDFILEKYKTVFLFSIGHHYLGKNRKTNKLTVYKNGKVVKEKHLYHIPTGNKLVFSILPFRSLLNLFQILLNVQKLYREYGKIDLYFSVNGYAAWIGLVLKKLGLVNKTIYWICDYYPIKNDNIIVYAIRWLYWRFEKIAAKSDLLAFHNTRLLKVWKKGGLIAKDKKYCFVPIGTNKSKIKRNKNLNKVELVFLGVLKRSQGLDYIFDNGALLEENFPGIKLNILGPGPDTDYFKNRAKKEKLNVHFFGYLGDEKINSIIFKSTIGIAPYVPDSSSVSFYGDPGKIKRYISLGLPVVATNIHEFPKELENHQAGALVKYGDSKQLVNSIKKILKNYEKYSSNASKLNTQFYYKNIYPKMFEI